jgi:hypothetical protein
MVAIATHDNSSSSTSTYTPTPVNLATTPEGKKMLDGYEWYLQQANSYNSRDTTNNSYKSSIPAQQTELSQLRNKTNQEGVQYTNLVAENLLLIQQISAEDNKLIELNSYLEDFE